MFRTKKQIKVLSEQIEKLNNQYHELVTTLNIKSWLQKTDFYGNIKDDIFKEELRNKFKDFEVAKNMIVLNHSYDTAVEMLNYIEEVENHEKYFNEVSGKMQQRKDIESGKLKATSVYSTVSDEDDDDRVKVVVCNAIRKYMNNNKIKKPDFYIANLSFLKNKSNIIMLLNEDEVNMLVTLIIRHKTINNISKILNIGEGAVYRYLTNLRKVGIITYGKDGTIKLREECVIEHR